MNKALAGLLGLAVVGGALFLLLQGTKSAHLELEGSILKVRVLDAGEGASLVVADFRVKNPSAIPFVVETVEMTLESASGEKHVGRMIAKSQMETVFQAKTVIGGKYNDILSLQDRVGPGETMDRTAAARFEVPTAGVDTRKGLRLRIEEIDGAIAELGEGGIRQ